MGNSSTQELCSLKFSRQVTGEKENSGQFTTKMFAILSSIHLLQFSSLPFVSFQPSFSSDRVNPHKERDFQTWRRQEADHKCQCVRTEFNQDCSHMLVAQLESPFYCEKSFNTLLCSAVTSQYLDYSKLALALFAVQDTFSK